MVTITLTIEVRGLRADQDRRIEVVKNYPNDVSALRVTQEMVEPSLTTVRL